MSKARASFPPLPVSPKSTSPAVRASMIGNRSTQTRPETALQEALIAIGLDRFVRHGPLQGTPDIAFDQEKVAIFVHGCYWHRCPYCSPHFPSTNQAYWSAKFARNKERDKSVKRGLKELGWQVVVVWECKVFKNPIRQARRVSAWLSKRGDAKETSSRLVGANNNLSLPNASLNKVGIVGAP